jgi:vitamin K-dependent gamma-carboxylase
MSTTRLRKPDHSVQRTGTQPSSSQAPHDKHERPSSTAQADGLVMRTVRYLMSEEDAAWIGFYRMFWGSIMAYEIYSHISYDFGKTNYLYLSSLHFRFPYFSWVERMPLQYMKVFLYAMLGLASCITLGLFYRIASVLFAFGFAYLFLLEQSVYLNHFYLICLIAFVMCFLPANAVFSIDAWLWPARYKRNTLPRYCCGGVGG